MLHAVIMAGGAGTRFWPASRAHRPKQLLNLVGERTMIQATCDRAAGLLPPENMLVVTNESLVTPIRKQLPQLPAKAVIGEPCKRDTAPCVALAAAIVARRDADATMLVMPADHVIRATEAFHAAVGRAQQVLADRPQWLITFGIPPSYPAESFGYIERGELLAIDGDSSQPAAYQVKMFREKPSASVAAEYLARGGFYWNAGIFVWRAETILKVLATYEPQMHDRAVAIAKTFGSEAFEQRLASEFPEMTAKSVDYAVLEKYPSVAVIEAPFDWDDLGNWRSLSRQHTPDEAGNTVVGRYLSVGSRGCIVRGADDHLIVTLGMEDCIVVHTPDATLVARKQDEEAVRRVVELLREKGWDEYL